MKTLYSIASLKLCSVFFILCSALSFQTTAQTIEVYDTETQGPLDGVHIRFYKSKVTVITNSNGKADIPAELQSGDSVCFYMINYFVECKTFPIAPGQDYKIGLTYDPTGNHNVVISASRFEEDQSDIPQQVVTIDQQDIRFMNQPTTAELLQNTGEVYVQKSQMGGGSPVIRGFEASKVLLVTDGVRMNNAIYRSGHLQNIITLDQNMADRIEIVYGAGSVLYGSDALGGVIHYQSRMPYLSDSFAVHGNAYTRYGSSNNEATGHIDLNFGWKKWALLVGGTYSNFNDLRQGQNRNPMYGKWGLDTFNVVSHPIKDSVESQSKSYMQEYTGYKQYDIQTKVLFQPKSTQQHILSVQLSNSSDIPRYDRLTQTASGKPRYAEWYYGPQTRLFSYYRWENSKAHTWYDRIRLTGAFQYVEESRHDRRLNNANLNNRTEKVQVYSFNADLSKEIKKHELRYGGEFTYNIVNSTAFSNNINNGTEKPIDTRYPDGGSIMYSGALYVTDNFELSKKTILSAGIRYNNVHLKSTLTDTTFYPFPYSEIKQGNQAVCGQLGLVHKFSNHWRAIVNTNTGFRAPNVDDVAKIFESTPGRVIVPNNELKPEYTWNVEGGVEYSIDKIIKIETRAWYTWYTNAITLQKSTFNGQDSIMYDGQLSAVYKSTNANKAYIYGGYFTIRATPTGYLELYSSLTYTYGRIVTDSVDTPLDHIPPVYGRTGFLLKFKKIKFEGWALYNGWKNLEDYSPSGEDNLPNHTAYGAPSWYTLNARISFKIHPAVTFQAALENIMDSFYRTFSSGVSGPGRNVSVTLRANF